MITRIKSAEGYKDEYPVLYVNPGSISDKSLEKLEPLSEIQNAPYWDLNFYVNDFAEYQEDLNYLFEVYTDKEVETLFILLSQLYAGIENLEKRAAMKKDREI